MMDRYDGDTFELDLQMRAGYQFMASASAIYDALKKLSTPRQIKLKEKLQVLRTATDLAGNMWLEVEQKRPSYTIPVNLKQDYEFAKNRYLHTKANPEKFYEKDLKQREALEQERKMLVEKIAKKEVEIARVEDDNRLEIRNQRIQIDKALRVLAARRRKYEELINKKSISLFTSCFGSFQDRLKGVIEDINKLQESLKNLTNKNNPLMDDQLYQLNLLRKRRFEIGKILNVPEDHHYVHVARWQNAVDIAETVMLVREMDIDSAANRYYSSEPVDVTHAFLSVYGQIKEILALPIQMNDAIKSNMAALTTYADQLHAPALAGRSVETLYKKIVMLNEEDKNQVLYHKPESKHLPDALMRALSVKSLQVNKASFGLYRKVLSTNDISVKDSLPAKKI